MSKSLKSELYSRVYKQGNCWKISVQRDGVRKTFYSYKNGEKGRHECAQKAADWIACCIDKASATADVTVDDEYKNFIERKKKKTTDIYTIENRYKNHIKPKIGNKKVSKLTMDDLQKVIEDAFENNSAADTAKHKLSRKTLINLRGDLSEFCKYLDRANIRHNLYASELDIPKGAVYSRKKILTAKDIAILFSATDTILNKKVVEDDLLYAYRFQLVTGLRPGELMGLQWGDIHETHIEICRSINAKGIQTNGKNENAHRSFPQTKYTREILKAQEKYRSNSDNPHERIFGDTGQLCYRERWGKFCAYNGIPYVTPYELRHTFASINKMMPLWALDELMGHSHVGVTLGIYAHAFDGELNAMADLLDHNIDEIIAYGKGIKRNI